MGPKWHFSDFQMHVWGFGIPGLCRGTRRMRHFYQKHREKWFLKSCLVGVSAPKKKKKRPSPQIPADTLSGPLAPPPRGNPPPLPGIFNKKPNPRRPCRPGLFIRNVHQGWARPNGDASAAHEEFQHKEFRALLGPGVEKKPKKSRK